MSVRWTELAANDLTNAADHIAEDDPAAALGVVESILSAVDLLADGRFDGPEFTLPNGTPVRRWVVGKFLVIYERAGDTLVILRVYHGRRDPQKL